MPRTREARALHDPAGPCLRSRLGPTCWAGVPNLASWLARRAWISAQTPVIRAVCTENINRPFHQYPAPSLHCGQMPGKPLTEMRGLLLPRFTACWQKPRYLLASSVAFRACQVLRRAKRRCHFTAALL